MSVKLVAGIDLTKAERSYEILVTFSHLIELMVKYHKDFCNTKTRKRKLLSLKDMMLGRMIERFTDAMMDKFQNTGVEAELENIISTAPTLEEGWTSGAKDYLAKKRSAKYEWIGKAIHAVEENRHESN